MTTRRLFSAVLVCLALVVSQMAHAEQSAKLEVIVMAVTSAEAGHQHVNSFEQSSGQHDRADEASDINCASYCPPGFVPAYIQVGPRALRGEAAFYFVVTSLTGSSVPTPDRPPRT